MKRDMELIRKLLLFFEEQEKRWFVKDVVMDGYEPKQLEYHILLMFDAELLIGSPRHMVKAGLMSKFIPTEIERLSFKGHEYLEAMRSNTTWNQAKDAIKKKGIALTVDSLFKLLKKYGEEAYGLITGLGGS